MLTTPEVAKELGIDPRALRRFLRSSPEWKAAGLGGRYAFTPADIDKLREQMKQPRPRRSTKDQPGITIKHMHAARHHGGLRRMQLDQRAARAERLAELIRKANA